MSPRRPLPEPICRGFTIVEMVIVIVIAGIVAGMAAKFISMPVNAYFDTERRARLTEAADTALRRISRDLRTALPNSVRVVALGGTTYLEFIPTVGGGRYRNYPASGAVPGNPLDFNVADAAFDVLGPVPVYAAGNSVVVYNLGPGTLADAYAGTNLAAVTSANAVLPGAASLFSTDAAPHTVTLAAAILFPASSPSSLFQMVSTPVTYACTPGAAGTLVRYEGYAFSAVQPTPPAGVPNVLVNGVTACSIAYDPAALRARTALITLSLTLGEAGEGITTVHQIHVQNTP
jgi:MSHA biogenesis protein MshO